MSTPSVKSDEIERLRKKYPDRIPIFLVKGENVTFEIPKTKYLVPSTLTFGEFIYSIRRMCKLKPEKAMFFYINNSLMNSSELISTIYATHKDVDGTLHLTYSEENTFG
jgi:GABA(A) receptor-associated protein